MNITESIIREVYESLPYGRVASIIESHHDVKVTDTLVEKYIELASQRKFTFDPVIFEIRKLNKFDNNLVEEKLEFILEDKSTIVITQECYEILKLILEHIDGATEYCSKSKENFMKMFETINK